MGVSPKDSTTFIEVIIEEKPLQAALVDFAWRILVLSLVISLITATLVYLSLQWLLVRPMRRITASMTAFRNAPEKVSPMFAPSKRRDEIGVAQRELAHMQDVLRAALRQKDRLAALGTGVAKISHDLRGILSSALLVSDRLEDSDDPEVRRVTPTLIAAIDRAVGLCSDTLDYVRHDQLVMKRSHFPLAALIADVGMAASLSENAVLTIDNRVSPDLSVTADRDQLFRVLTNLTQNAAEAGARQVVIGATDTGDGIEINVSDNGPGIPKRALERLFRPFEGSVRAGGTGLGLPIARELMRGHGGDLSLVRSGVSGTQFCLHLPPA
jgi:signal transduction histidine kinase